jgi:hypothetical protein
MAISSAPRRGAMRAWSLAAIATVGLALMMAFAGPARAVGYPPTPSCTVSISPDLTIHAGEHVIVSGSGFAPDQTVVMTINSPRTITLDVVTSNGSGAFRTPETMPSSLAPGPHRIIAQAPSTSCSLGVTVDSGQPTVAPANGSSSGLASTGFPVIATVAGAATLLIGGALFLLLGRGRGRRRA